MHIRDADDDIVYPDEKFYAEEYKRGRAADYAGTADLSYTNC